MTMLPPQDFSRLSELVAMTRFLAATGERGLAVLEPAREAVTIATRFSDSCGIHEISLSLERARALLDGQRPSSIGDGLGELETLVRQLGSLDPLSSQRKALKEWRSAMGPAIPFWQLNTMVAEVEPDIPLYPMGRYQSVGGNLNPNNYSSVVEVIDRETSEKVVLKLELSDEDSFGMHNPLPRKMMENEWRIGQEIKDMKDRLFRRVLHRFVTQNGHLVLIMEHVEGENLGQILKRKTRLQPNEAVKIGIEVLEGLQILHHHKGGIVHLDLHPGNLILMPNGAVKVIDLGIAKRMRDISHSDPCNRIGVKGYAPPEAYVKLNLGHQRRRSDIFSLAACLYEALTGHRAFPDKSQLSSAYREQPPPIWNAIPPSSDSRARFGLLRLNTIIAQGLKYRMEDRYRWAKDFADALITWQQEFGHLEF